MGAMKQAVGTKPKCKIQIESFPNGVFLMYSLGTFKKIVALNESNDEISLSAVANSVDELVRIFHPTTQLFGSSELQQYMPNALERLRELNLRGHPVPNEENFIRLYKTILNKSY